MATVVILTSAQIELYCKGLTDLVWEPPRANACAHAEAQDILEQFAIARWHAGALGSESPNERIVRELAQQLSPKLNVWFDPTLWRDGLSDLDAARVDLLEAIESLKQAALENLRH